MGIFNFTSEFEITVNHPKEEAFNRFRDYVINKGNLSISDYELYDMLTFTKDTTLFSWPIDFYILFNEAGKSQTTLTVKSSSESIDLGKAKKIICKIVDIIY
jgi:hypothetical protein